MLKLNLKQFLLLPLNSGLNPWNTNSDCGCIKGNFYKTLLPEATPVEINANLAKLFGNPICGTDPVTLGKVYDKDGIRYAKPALATIHQSHPKLGEVLDIAEMILINGFPQRAKDYVATMIRKFNLCEITDDFIRESEVVEKEAVLVK